MRDSLPLAVEPGALSWIEGGELWERGPCCRCTTTLFTPSPRGRGDMAALSVPHDTAYASQASASGMPLGTSGRQVGARAACRAGATAYGHRTADTSLHDDSRRVITAQTAQDAFSPGLCVLVAHARGTHAG